MTLSAVVSKIRQAKLKVTTWYVSLNSTQKVIVVLGLVTLLLIISRLMGSNQDSNNTTESAPARITENPSNSQSTTPNDVKAMALQALPHTEEAFSIVYLGASDTFMITVTAPPYEQSAAQAYAWLEAKGITRETSSIKESWSRFKQY